MLKKGRREGGGGILFDKIDNEKIIKIRKQKRNNKVAKVH